MQIFSFRRSPHVTLAHLYRLGTTFVPPNCKFADFDNVPMPMQLLCYGTPCTVEYTAFTLFCWSLVHELR